MTEPTIKIGNVLEILDGNKIAIPGCEALSAFSSNTLAENMQCSQTTIDLCDAVAAVPGARIIFGRNFGNFTTGGKKFFVLPDGPPPNHGCGSCTVNDWYQILKNAAEEAADDATSNGVVDCDAFNWNNYTTGKQFSP